MSATTWFCAVLLASTALGGCGSDDKVASTPSEETETPDGSEQPQIFNGCAASDYEDRSAESAERVIQIAVEGLKFTPPCLEIAQGQAVRFEGSLSAHPLAPGNPDDASAGSANNPITATSSGARVEFSFPRAGTYPYFCELHAFGAGMGMAGAIYVR
jgi:plastocyanin